MAIDLFAGISVSNYAAALEWYGRLFGSTPAFFPNDTEAVWETAEHRYLYIVLRPEHAGHAIVLLFIEDLETRVAAMAQRQLSPTHQQTYPDGVRKIRYRDPDGNEISFGGAQRA